VAISRLAVGMLPRPPWALILMLSPRASHHQRISSSLIDVIEASFIEELQAIKLVGVYECAEECIGYFARGGHIR